LVGRKEAQTTRKEAVILFAFSAPFCGHPSLETNLKADRKVERVVPNALELLSVSKF
jgi:hypothetical protein